MAAYYNEIDPFKAEVIREAIKAGVIAPGYVDERSIADVKATDLMGYTQCHFFAGGGFWSYVLRQAGWPDDRPVWTGSCPCPSFSSAGKGEGFADARHLWPEWFRLIRERRPATIFGEQVDAAIGHGWLDLVGMDLEDEGYALAAAVLPAASVGAPHKRNRLFFCANAGSRTSQRDAGSILTAQEGFNGAGIAVDGRMPVGHCDGGTTGSGAQPLHTERRLVNLDGEDGRDGEDRGRQEAHSIAGTCGEICQCGDGARLEGYFGNVREWRGPGWLDPQQARSIAATGATRGFWADCDWWYGRDEKYRPAGPGIQPLAYGSPARVGRLRLYGDAICIPAAQAFIEAYLITEQER